MAKKHLFISERWMNGQPGLRHAVWMMEAGLLRSLAGLVGTMKPERAYLFAETFLRTLKPVLHFTKTIRLNVTVAFPQLPDEEVDRLTGAICGNLGRSAVDLWLAERIWRERDQRIEFVMEPGMDLARYRDRPAVLVGGHIGAWQFGSFVAAKYGIPITTVFAPEQNPYLKKLCDRWREALPMTFISRDGCMRGLCRQLRLGGAVALTTDTRADNGELVDFFDKPIRVNTAAARLALKHDCDLIPVRVERLPEFRFRITVCRPIECHDPDAAPTERVKQLTAQLFRHFEHWVIENPDQWMCFSRRWPHEAYPT